MIGVVIPTIFSRPKYLPLAVRSLRDAGDCYVLLSCPEPTGEQLTQLDTLMSEGLIDEFVVEAPGASLPGKIDDALRSLPEVCTLMTWLGDDDLLNPGSLTLAQKTLEATPQAVMVYGGVKYVDENGRALFTNPSSQLHEKMLRFGPQLIPQPGSVWRRSAFEAVNGLSSQFNLAFDFDLFLKFSRIGQLKHIDQTLAQFRWHSDSLSVRRRWHSVTEASRVRRNHYLGLCRFAWWAWEPLVILATWFAGKLVELRIWQLNRLET